MTAQYVPLLLMMAVGVVLVAVFFGLSSFLGTKRMTREKAMPYECGVDSTGSQGLRPSVKFFLTAILFVVFDVEVIFLYPWAVEFKGLGWTGLLVMLPFLGLLGLGMLYEWRKGALEWEE
jgi:NADH-quinone oxidoreductase subunit A